MISEDFMKSFHEIDVSIANLMAQPVQDLSELVDMPAEPDVMEEYDDEVDEEDIQRQVVEEYQHGKWKDHQIEQQVEHHFQQDLYHKLLTLCGYCC